MATDTMRGEIRKLSADGIPEEELDKAFSEGVDAGMEHEVKAEKERKDAAMAKVRCCHHACL